jgi:CheY-like chemotaxis protein
MPAVLVVDDDPNIRCLIRATLEDSGYAVKEAENADEAISFLDEVDGVSVVLTDIKMPGHEDGLHLAWLIRAMWPSISVVVMSGQTLPRPEELPVHVGVLTKPFSAQRLVAAIATAV